MAERRHVDDPGQTGGKTAGVGGPHDRNAVVYDTRNMVVVEEMEVSVAHTTSGGVPNDDRVALMIRGRRNRPPDDAPSAEAPKESVEHLHMLSWDAAADLVVDLQALASRDGSFGEFNLDLAEVCCCGHPAGSHNRSKDVVGVCQIDGCDCTVFHVHGS